MGAKENRRILLAVYIFSFVIMLFGVAFSYFTARTRSENNALNIKSGHISLELEVAQKYAGKDLIPTNDSDIMTAYHKKCIDDKNRGACSAYDITVTNRTARQDVTGIIDFDINHIENLSYLVLDEDEKIYQNITKISESTKNMPLGSNFILDDAVKTGIATKRKFTLIIWLSNYDHNQNEDKDGTFEATVTYNSVYSQKLSSTISGYERNGD